MAAVWKYDDQSDLQWVPLAMYDGDVWKGNINISGYDSPEGHTIFIYISWMEMEICIILHVHRKI